MIVFVVLQFKTEKNSDNMCRNERELYCILGTELKVNQDS